MKLIPILSEEVCKKISEKVEDDKDILKVYSQAFKDIKGFIEKDYQEEIRLNKSIHETQRFIDHETEEFRRAYMLGYHDGKMKIYETLTNLLTILNNPCTELFNQKWEKVQKEMEENGEIK